MRVPSTRARMVTDCKACTVPMLCSHDGNVRRCAGSTVTGTAEAEGFAGGCFARGWPCEQEQPRRSPQDHRRQRSTHRFVRRPEAPVITSAHQPYILRRCSASPVGIPAQDVARLIPSPAIVREIARGLASVNWPAMSPIQYATAAILLRFRDAEGRAEAAGQTGAVPRRQVARAPRPAMRITANSGSRRKPFAQRLRTPSISRDVAVDRHPQAAATAARSVSERGMAVLRPVSPKRPLSITAIDRLAGRAAAMVANDPMPISISPSPVMTNTRRWAVQSEAEPDHGGAAHGAPQVEIERAIAGGAGVVAGRAQAGDHQQLARVPQQFAATARRSSVPSFLMPIPSLRPLQFHEHLRADQTLREQHRHRHRAIEGEGGGGGDHVGDIIGMVRAMHMDAGGAQHGSGRAAHRHLPRIELAPFATHRDQGEERHAAVLTGRLSMLMQLPTPEDCISSTARCPPSQAPAARAMPSSSVVSTTACMSGSACAGFDQARVPGVRARRRSGVMRAAFSAA